MSDSPNKGGRKPRVTDEDLLDVFRTTGDPVLSTSEVADALPIKRRGTLTRLRNLEEQGILESKQIGGRNTVWWLVDPEGMTTEVDPDEPLFSGEQLLAPEDPVDETEIDDVLYSEPDG